MPQQFTGSRAASTAFLKEHVNLKRVRWFIYLHRDYSSIGYYDPNFRVHLVPKVMLPNRQAELMSTSVGP